MGYSPDGLAKRLHHHLSAAGVAAAEMRTAKWFDFRDHDRPDTDSPAVMVAAALVEVWADEAGRWFGNRAVLAGAVTFMRECSRLQATYSETDLADLKRILDAVPVNREHLSEWFNRVWPF